MIRPVSAYKPSPSDAQLIGQAEAKDAGFTGSQWTCLKDLWTRESGWRWNAQNPTSPAYGIPQANPGSKMAAVNGNWQTNAKTQVDWGLKYIKGTYGTPCQANAFQRAHGGY